MSNKSPKYKISELAEIIGINSGALYQRVRLSKEPPVAVRLKIEHRSYRARNAIQNLYDKAEFLAWFRRNWPDHRSTGKESLTAPPAG